MIIQTLGFKHAHETCSTLSIQSVPRSSVHCVRTKVVPMAEACFDTVWSTINESFYDPDLVALIGQHFAITTKPEAISGNHTRRAQQCDKHNAQCPKALSSESYG